MSKTAVLDDLDLLFEEGRGNSKATPAKLRKAGVVPKSKPIEVSSLAMIRELYKRHSYIIYCFGFWIELALIVWWRLGK